MYTPPATVQWQAALVQIFFFVVSGLCNFTWHPLKRTLRNADSSRTDAVVEDNTGMCSLSGDGSVVVIGMDAIWRGNVDAVCVHPPSLGIVWFSASYPCCICLLLSFFPLAVLLRRLSLT